jgi:hypothetical protein
MHQDWHTMLEGVVDANQKVVTAAVELNRIATRTRNMLARRQLEMLDSCLQAGTRHLEVVVRFQDPAQAMKHHTDVAVQLGEKLAAAAQDVLEIQVQARDAMGRWADAEMDTVEADVETVPDARTAPSRKSPRSRKKVA